MLLKTRLPILFISVLLGTLVVGCVSKRKSESSKEVSLKADRSYLDKERKDIPEGLQENNDFLALVLKDMAEVKLPPATVRDRFFREVRKVRDRFNKIQREKREAFNKEERNSREELLTKLKKERDSFTARKRDRDESKEFFQKQNNERTAFFENQKDKRKDFESTMEEDRRGFNEEMSLRQKTFDDAYREYQKKYMDLQKEKKQLQKSGGSGGAGSEIMPPAGQVSPGRAPVVEQYPGQLQDLEDLKK